MPSWNLNPYGLRDGRIVYVEDLDENSEFGLNCNCTCPSCGDKFVARIRGEKKQKHFAHKSGADCGKAYESALHRLAKQIIEDGVKIKLPPVTSAYGNKGYFVIDGVVRFPATYSIEEPITPDEGKTVIEKDMGTFRPDVSIEYNGNELFIEIQVTHPVDDEKKKLIQKTDISCVEFDFSYYKDRVLEESDIRRAFEGNDGNVEVRWIYSKKNEKRDSIIKSNLDTSLFFDPFDTKSGAKPRRGAELSEYGYIHELANDKEKVLNCPLKKHLDGEKHYAKLEECSCCEGCSGFIYALGSDTPSSILCRKGDNNVKVEPQDAARWLIYLSNHQFLPNTEKKCVDLIESDLKKLGPLADHSFVKDVKEKAIENIISRFNKKLKVERDNGYQRLDSTIEQILNLSILHARSTYEEWRENAQKKVFDDLPENLRSGFPEKEIDSIVDTLSKNIWDCHCNEGERLFRNKKSSFRSIISSFIDKPVNCGETQKEWLYRVTTESFPPGHGPLMYDIPLLLIENKITEISILPFLEKITKERFYHNGINNKRDSN